MLLWHLGYHRLGSDEQARNRGRILLRIVIDASSEEEDRQVKSKWVLTLEYAIAKGVRGTAFKNFLKKNGGVDGCARKMAQLRREGNVGRERRKQRNPRA